MFAVYLCNAAGEPVDTGAGIGPYGDDPVTDLFPTYKAACAAARTCAEADVDLAARYGMATCSLGPVCPWRYVVTHEEGADYEYRVVVANPAVLETFPCCV